MTAEQMAADVREIADVVVDAADYNKLHKAADLIERQAAEIARLRDALEPFADCCESIEPNEDDEEWAKFRLLIGNYRRARKAMENTGG